MESTTLQLLLRALERAEPPMSSTCSETTRLLYAETERFHHTQTAFQAAYLRELANYPKDSEVYAKITAEFLRLTREIEAEEAKETVIRRAAVISRWAAHPG